MESSARFADIAKQFKLSPLPHSEVELVGEVPFDVVVSYQPKALAHIAEHVSLPGFRPGKVPHELAQKHVGELAVLEEAVELFVKDFYVELIEAHQIEAVGRPDIRVTKLATGNPVGLTVRATVYPQVTLPKNWKELHQKHALEASLPATDEEVAQTLETLRTNKQKTGGEGAPLPELNDEFAKSLPAGRQGSAAFRDLEHLKEQIKKGIGEEKQRAARDKRRGALIEAVVEASKLEVPALFVESELEKIISQMREDVQRFGMTFEDYLKQSGKTEADIRQDFRQQAEKRAKLQLILNKIATEEKLDPEESAVEHEMHHALEHFPEAKPDLLKIHIETVLRNELALKLLEGELKNELLK